VTYARISTNGKSKLIFLFLLLSMCVHISKPSERRYSCLWVCVSIMVNGRKIANIITIEIKLLFFSSVLSMQQNALMIKREIHLFRIIITERLYIFLFCKKQMYEILFQEKKRSHIYIQKETLVRYDMTGKKYTYNMIVCISLLSLSFYNAHITH
jgi:hypothetical protein